MKKCRSCKEIKSLLEFHKCNKVKNGHKSICKECRITERKNHYVENKERITNQSKMYYEKTKTERIQYSRNYYTHNKERYAKWHKNDYLINKEKMLKNNKQWCKNNPEKRALHAADRRFNLQQATPSWYEENLIKQLYLKRDELNNKWNTNFEVDHIIPINPRDE